MALQKYLSKLKFLKSNMLWKAGGISNTLVTENGDAISQQLTPPSRMQAKHLSCCVALGDVNGITPQQVLTFESTAQNEPSPRQWQTYDKLKN